MKKQYQRYRNTYRQNHSKHVKRARLAARHPFAVPVFTLLCLIGITGLLLAIFNRQPATISPNVVYISHDSQQQIVSSKEPTVGALLKKLNLKVNDGDIVEPVLSTPIQQDDFRINIYRAVPVAIVDGDQKQFAFSAATTSRSVARQAGLTIYPEDTIETRPVSNFVADGSIGHEVIIDRATPINVNLYGAPIVMRTHATTIRQLLAEKKVNLKPQDIVNPGIDAPITADARIAIIRNGLTTATVQEDIPMPVQLVPDNTLSYGVSAVRQQGAPGKRAVTYEINTQNGVEVSRKAMQTVIVQQPVTQITAQGANLSGIKGDMALAGIAPSDYQYADYIIGRESGWCPTKWQGEYGGCPPYHGTPTDPSVGYGLCQSTPGSKMANASRGGGPDWGTNPVTQLRWCNHYAVTRHGGWAGAYNYWLRNHHW
ncbi:MAG TPA: G5 domain-containing protein [Candidatus Saccharimonadales bacterium]|jgi:uncharacterized protein YabE (DUF348 family)